MSVGKCRKLILRFKDIYFIEPQAKSKILNTLLNFIEAQNPFANNDKIGENEVEDNFDSTNSNNCIDLWSLHRSLEKKQKNKTKSGSHERDEIHSYLDKSVIGLKEDPIIEWKISKELFKSI